MYYTIPNAPTLSNNNLPPCNNFGTNACVLPSPIQSFQQNSPMSFLSLPPPNLPATHHVFQNVPCFNNTGNQNLQILPTSSIIINTSVPPPPLISPVRPSLPNIKPFENNGNSWNPAPPFNNNPFHDNSRHLSNFQNPTLHGTNKKNVSHLPFAPPEGIRSSFQSISAHSVSRPPSFNNKQWPRNSFSSSGGSSRNFHKSGDAGSFSNSGTANHGQSSFKFETPTTFPNTNTINSDPKFAFKNTSNYGSRNHKSNYNSWNSPVSNYNRPLNHFKCSNDSDFKTNFSNREELSFSDSSESSNNFQTNQNHGEYGSKSWMTQEISAAIEEKRLLFSQAKSTDDPSIWEAFRKQRNHISGLIRSAKSKAGIQDRRSMRRSNESSLPYACDTCDRAFASESEFHSHISEHIKCNVGNCQFEAHPKIVCLHKKMQHETGYADAISKLKDDKEIQKWREERRRRFPTTANILKRKAEQAEKEARGEVIENKEFGKFKKQRTDKNENQQNNRSAGRGRNRHQHSRSNRKFENRHKVAAPLPAPDSDSDTDDDSHIKIPRFLGILAVPDSNSLETLENLNPEEKSVTIVDELKKSEGTDEIQVTLEASDSGNAIVFAPEEEVPALGIEKGTDIESKVPNVINVDSDDEAPAELPILKGSAVEFSSSVGSDEKSLNCTDHIDSVKESEISNPIDIDSDDEAPFEIPILKAPVPDSSNFGDPCEQNNPRNHKDDMEKSELPTSLTVDSDDEAPTGLAIVKEPPVGASDGSINNSTNHKDTRSCTNFPRRNRETTNKNDVDKSYNNPVRKSTLLEKLLADDIRHERNLIMQCVRHVVKNNFFGIGQNGKASERTDVTPQKF